jgi:ankyrin repeat protein
MPQRPQPSPKPKKEDFEAVGSLASDETLLSFFVEFCSSIDRFSTLAVFSKEVTSLKLLRKSTFKVKRAFALIEKFLSPDSQASVREHLTPEILSDIDSFRGNSLLCKKFSVTQYFAVDPGLKNVMLFLVPAHKRALSVLRKNLFKRFLESPSFASLKDAAANSPSSTPTRIRKHRRSVYDEFQDEEDEVPPPPPESSETSPRESPPGTPSSRDAKTKVSVDETWKSAFSEGLTPYVVDTTIGWEPISSSLESETKSKIKTEALFSPVTSKRVQDIFQDPNSRHVFLHYAQSHDVKIDLSDQLGRLTSADEDLISAYEAFLQSSDYNRLNGKRNVLSQIRTFDTSSLVPPPKEHGKLPRRRVWSDDGMSVDGQISDSESDEMGTKAFVKSEISLSKTFPKRTSGRKIMPVKHGYVDVLFPNASWRVVYGAVHAKDFLWWDSEEDFKSQKDPSGTFSLNQTKTEQVDMRYMTVSQADGMPSLAAAFAVVSKRDKDRRWVFKGKAMEMKQWREVFRQNKEKALAEKASEVEKQVQMAKEESIASSIHVLDEDGNNILMRSALKGDVEMTSKALALKANVLQVNTSGKSVLHCAIIGGNVKVFKLFRPYTELDINLPDELGCTPLHYALTVELAALLLSSGANPESSDHRGCTPFLSACYRLRPEDESQFQLIRFFLSFGVNINVIDNAGVSPLSLSAMKNDSRLMQALLEEGANPNVKKSNEMLAVHHAALNGSSQALKILLNAGADCEDTALFEDMYRTPMHLSVMKNSLECLKILLGTKASPNIPDDSGRTALHYASMSGNVKAVEMILGSAECEADLVDDEEKSALDLALEASRGPILDTTPYLRIQSLLLGKGSHSRRSIILRDKSDTEDLDSQIIENALFDSIDSRFSVIAKTDIKSIRNCTLDDIIRRLTFITSSDSTAISAFLSYYPKFNSGTYVLSKLKERYEKTEGFPLVLVKKYDANKAKLAKLQLRFEEMIVLPIRLRVCNFVKVWIKNHFDNIIRNGDAFFDQLKSFCLSLKTAGNLKKLYETAEAQEVQRRELFATIMFRIPGPAKKILDFPASALARQLTLWEYGLMANICQHEFLDMCWKSKDGRERAPNLWSCFDHSNFLTQWVTTEILKASSKEARRKTMEFFIEVANVI